MNPPVRVRFAPSPTGFLHIGGARTALFNFLYARAKGGKFLLRIEDTDLARSETRFTEDIMESLKWLGLNWDEEPVYQSKRFSRYTELADQLLAKNLAFRCDCSPETLNALREKCEKDKKPFRYPGTCRDKKTVNSPHVIRVKTPSDGETAFTDLIRGPISFQNKDIDDWVIIRPDGSPTYNFCVVIDDHDLNISHILRGDDHINNTPKQILLYQALGFDVPNFAHLPMILGADRTKLSKRHGAASTLEYRTMGYLPDALVNFLVRLGWSHGDQEIFSLEELCKYFDLDHIGKANAIFATDKLNWISGHYYKEKKPAELHAYMRKYFDAETHFMVHVTEDRVLKGIQIIQGKVKLMSELIEQLKGLFGDDPKHDVGALKPEDKPNVLKILKDTLPTLKDSDFSHTDLDVRLRKEAEKMGVKLTPIAQAIRFGVTGGKVSPGLFDMLEVQGKETALRRIEKAIQVLSA